MWDSFPRIFAGIAAIIALSEVLLIVLRGTKRPLGWRRIAGHALLAITLLLIAFWFRSDKFEDSVSLEIPPSTKLSIVSSDGALHGFLHRGDATFVVRGHSIPRLQSRSIVPPDLVLGWIPHWSMAVPLTMLAAYLLLRDVTATRVVRP